jgi:hypothetical protein
MGMTEARGTMDGGDDLSEVPAEEFFSAGEAGAAVDAGGASEDAGQAQVIVGEIPDEHDLTKMLWTARCTFPPHGLLGKFATRSQAEQKKEEHLLARHGRR